MIENLTLATKKELMDESSDLETQFNQIKFVIKSKWDEFRKWLEEENQDLIRLSEEKKKITEELNRRDGIIRQ